MTVNQVFQKVLKVDAVHLEAEEGPGALANGKPHHDHLQDEKAGDKLVLLISLCALNNHVTSALSCADFLQLGADIKAKCHTFFRNVSELFV